MRYNKVVGLTADKDGQAFDVDTNCNTPDRIQLEPTKQVRIPLLCSPMELPGNSGIVVRYNLSIDDGEQKGLFCFVSDIQRHYHRK